MYYSEFIMALFEALVKCLEERRREDVEMALQNPGFRERRVACRLLRDQGFHGSDLRREVDEAMAYLADQDAEDISCLIDDALSPKEK